MCQRITRLLKTIGRRTMTDPFIKLDLETDGEEVVEIYDGDWSDFND